jgi:phage portal protein BeeE
MTSFVFRETLMSHLLLWGKAYAQIIRNDKGEVIELYPLMPNKMTVDEIQAAGFIICTSEALRMFPRSARTVRSTLPRQMSCISPVLCLT